MSMETDNWVDSVMNRHEEAEKVQVATKGEIHSFLDRMMESHPNRRIQHVEDGNGRFHTIRNER